jgi:hypothetical protein
MGDGQRRGLAGRWQLISMESSRRPVDRWDVAARCGTHLYPCELVGGVGRQLHGVGTTMQ